MRWRATLNLRIGMMTVCAPDETDRPARDLARSGGSVLLPGPAFAGGRSVEWTGGSGP